MPPALTRWARMRATSSASLGCAGGAACGRGRRGADGRLGRARRRGQGRDEDVVVRAPDHRGGGRFSPGKGPLGARNRPRRSPARSLRDGAGRRRSRTPGPAPSRPRPAPARGGCRGDYRSWATAGEETRPRRPGWSRIPARWCRLPRTERQSTGWPAGGGDRGARAGRRGRAPGGGTSLSERPARPRAGCPGPPGRRCRRCSLRRRTPRARSWSDRAATPGLSAWTPKSLPQLSPRSS